MAAVSAREANQQFSRILEAAVRGEEITITRRGVPVAKLVPVTQDDAQASAERARRKQEALAFFERGVDLGEPVAWTREELYMERFERNSARAR